MRPHWAAPIGSYPQLKQVPQGSAEAAPEPMGRCWQMLAGSWGRGCWAGQLGSPTPQGPLAMGTCGRGVGPGPSLPVPQSQGSAHRMPRSRLLPPQTLSQGGATSWEAGSGAAHPARPLGTTCSVPTSSPCPGGTGSSQDMEARWEGSGSSHLGKELIFRST